jgi:2-dehydropantoate 2-reductase
MLPRTDAEWGTALAELDRMAERFRDVYTGIWRDIAVRRRPTEADSSIGPLIEEGEKVGLAMPLNRTMKRLLNEIEDGRRTQSWENLEELVQVAEREEPLPTRAHEG